MQYTLEVNAQNKAFWKDLSPKQKATFMVATTGVNSLMGAVTGNTPLPDFLKAIFDSIADFGDDEQDGSALDKVGRTAQRFAGEAASMNPFTSVAANTLLTKGQRQGLFGKDSDLGRYDGTSAPIKVVQNAGSAAQNLFKGELGKSRDSALRTLPFGNQLRKSLSGVEAINSGDVAVTPWNASRAVLFGANAVMDDSSTGSSKRISDTKSSAGAVNASSTGSGRNMPDFTTDDILKGQFNSKEQKEWLKLSDSDKKAAAQSDDEKKSWYDQYQATKRINKDNPERPAGLSKESADILNWHSKRTPQQKEKLEYSQNDYDYKLALAKYEEDKLNGKISRADDINRQQKLRKEAVGKDFSKETRDIYNKLSKTEIYELAETAEDGQDALNKARAYGDALVAAGSLKYNKLGSKKSGSSKKSGGRKKSSKKGGSKGGSKGTYKSAKTTDISKKLQALANVGTGSSKSSVSTPKKHTAKLKKVKTA